MLARACTDNALNADEAYAPQPLPCVSRYKWSYAGHCVHRDRDSDRPWALLHLAIRHNRLDLVGLLLDLQVFGG